MKHTMLGKKIKDLRLRKRMTQAELAGDTITRNMLSQIENGVAQPSVSTIVELAERLGVPTEYFFSESSDLDAFRKLGAISRIRKYYAAGDFAKCLARLDSLGVSDDETEYLYARANFARGIERYHAGYLTSAGEFFEAAIAHAEKTVYVDSDFCLAAKHYLRVLAFVRAKEPKAELFENDDRNTHDFKADLAYIGAIAGRVTVFDYGAEYAVYAAHLTIREQMKDETQEILPMMGALKRILAEAEETRYAVLKYYVLCDLETLAGRIGDYKCAYECSSARLSLADKMNH